MSGGHFCDCGYTYYKVSQFADELEEEILNNNKEDEYGYVEFQLWSLMYQLGKYCNISCAIPFETVMLIDENNLRDVE